MARYTVTVDTSYYANSYEEITVEAETAAKAKYKAAKIFGYGGKDFVYFIQLFHPTVEKVADDTPLYRKFYTDENDERIMILRNIGMAKEV